MSPPPLLLLLQRQPPTTDQRRTFVETCRSCCLRAASGVPADARVAKHQLSCREMPLDRRHRRRRHRRRGQRVLGAAQASDPGTRIDALRASPTPDAQDCSSSPYRTPCTLTAPASGKPHTAAASQQLFNSISGQGGIISILSPGQGLRIVWCPWPRRVAYYLYCPQDRGCGHVPNALRANRATGCAWFTDGCLQRRCTLTLTSCCS